MMHNGVVIGIIKDKPVAKFLRSYKFTDNMLRIESDLLGFRFGHSDIISLLYFEPDGINVGVLVNGRNNAEEIRKLSNELSSKYKLSIKIDVNPAKLKEQPDFTD